MRGRRYSDIQMKPYPYPRIEMSDADIQRVTEFAKRLAFAKKDEPNHRHDLGGNVSRKVTGYLGELALEKLFGREIVDWTITVGNSFVHDHADLRKLGLNCGVKTVEQKTVRVFDFTRLMIVSQDRFPILKFADLSYPQVMNFRQGNTIIVCGVAMPEVLKRYQDGDLIEDPNISGKTGFWGFAEIRPFSTLSELEDILR